MESRLLIIHWNIEMSVEECCGEGRNGKVTGRRKMRPDRSINSSHEVYFPIPGLRSKVSEGSWLKVNSVPGIPRVFCRTPP